MCKYLKYMCINTHIYICTFIYIIYIYASHSIHVYILGCVYISNTIYGIHELFHPGHSLQITSSIYLNMYVRI